MKWALTFSRPPDTDRLTADYFDARSTWSGWQGLSNAGCMIERIDSPDGVVDKETLRRTAELEGRGSVGRRIQPSSEVAAHLLAASSRIRLAKFELERSGDLASATLLNIATALVVYVAGGRDGS